jgi:hypothetical protein
VSRKKGTDDKGTHTQVFAEKMGDILSRLSLRGERQTIFRSPLSNSLRVAGHLVMSICTVALTPEPLALNDMPIHPTPEEVANGGRPTWSIAGGG